MINVSEFKMYNFLIMKFVVITYIHNKHDKHTLYIIVVIR